jgi:hypothetical protein
MMNKNILTFFMVGVLTAGFIRMSDAAEKERAVGNVPIITAHFASSDLRPGDTLKIYLKASDPDGDMKYIVASVKQAGIGVSPVSFTRIRGENTKELSGYVYLNTMLGSDYASLTFFNLALTLWIQDRAGNFSAPVEVPVAFGSRVEAQAVPPSGEFKEQDLGPVMLTLRTMSAENTKGGLPPF